MDTDLLNKYIALYQHDLTRLCINLCCNLTESEDLYQETWLKAIRKYEQYDSTRPFDKWLFAICVNTFKDSRKSFWTSRQITFLTSDEKEFFLNSISDDTEIDKEDYLALRECVEMLPTKQKIIVNLIYFKDLTEADVALILNIPVGTVKSRLHKAKKTLREGLK